MLDGELLDKEKIENLAQIDATDPYIQIVRLMYPDVRETDHWDRRKTPATDSPSFAHAAKLPSSGASSLVDDE